MKILCLSLMLLSVPLNAVAEWEVLTPKESGALIELDTIRSRKLINNHVAFARTCLDDQQVEIKTEINCSKKKHKLLYQRVVDSRGGKVSESKEPRAWENIAPDSIFEVLMNRLCRRKAN